MYLVAMPTDYSYSHKLGDSRTEMILEVFDSSDLTTSRVFADNLLKMLVQGTVKVNQFLQGSVRVALNLYCYDEDWKTDRKYFENLVDNSQSYKTLLSIAESKYFGLNRVGKPTFNKYKKVGFFLQDDTDKKMVIVPELFLYNQFPCWNITASYEDYFFKNYGSCIVEKNMALWLARGVGQRGTPKVHLMLNVQNNQYIIDFIGLSKGIIRYRDSLNRAWRERKFFTEDELVDNYALFSGIGTDKDTNRLYLLLNVFSVYDKKNVERQMRIYLDEIESFPLQIGMLIGLRAMGNKPLYTYNGFSEEWRREHNRL